MNILENIMEDNGLKIPSVNDSFCLDGLKNLLAQKTKEFKEFAIESNNTLINASETNNALSHKNKYIQEFLIENKKEELEENKKNKEFYASEAENKPENSYLKISEGEDENENDSANLEESKANESDYSLEEDKEKDQINPISEDDSENKSGRDSEISSDFEKDFSKSKNKDNINNDDNSEKYKLDKTENNTNNITTWNAKYLELIEMFTKLDKKKTHKEEDLNYAIESIKEFKIDETRKNNLINDILKMKEKSTRKIDNLEGEINDVINKIIIQQNNNNESFLLNPLNNFVHVNKENKLSNDNNEILAELKNQAEIKNVDLLIETNNYKNDEQITLGDELNFENNSENNNKIEQNKIIASKESQFQIEKEEINIPKDEILDAFINISKNSKRSLEKSKEISFEINNYNEIIRIDSNSSNKIFYLKNYQNSETTNNFKKENFSCVNNHNINLNLLKTTNFPAGESVNIKNLIKENYYANQENFNIINSNRNTNIINNEKEINIEINTNNSNNININTNINNIIKINSEGKSLNSDQGNILNNLIIQNEQTTPKLKTNFLKKYSNINSNNNFIFNGIMAKNINYSNNNSLNSSNINANNLNNNNNSVKYSEKDKNMFNNPSTNNTNEKEYSISKLKLSTPINQEDEFITSTNPQTNNLLVNEFASSIDDEKNKVIEDLFFKLKEYSNKIPELNNLINTYKDKLNVKNPYQNVNLANLIHSHFTDNNDFNLNANNNLIINHVKNNKHKDLSKINSESKNNSIELKLKLINIDNLEVNCNNISNNGDKKSILSEKEAANSSKQGNGNSYSEKNLNLSRNSKKTEIISHLELKAEKVF